MHKTLVLAALVAAALPFCLPFPASASEIASVGIGSTTASVGASVGSRLSFNLDDLLQTTHADLAAAQADADAHGDRIASQCYAGVSAYIDAHPLSFPSVGAVQGLASGFQVARDGVKTFEGIGASAGIPQELEIACGPLALDVQSDLGKTVARFSLFGLRF